MVIEPNKLESKIGLLHHGSILSVTGGKLVEVKEYTDLRDGCFRLFTEYVYNYMDNKDGIIKTDKLELNGHKGAISSYDVKDDTIIIYKTRLETLVEILRGFPKQPQLLHSTYIDHK